MKNHISKSPIKKNSILLKFSLLYSILIILGCRDSINDIPSIDTNLSLSIKDTAQIRYLQENAIKYLDQFELDSANIVLIEANQTGKTLLDQFPLDSNLLVQDLITNNIIAKYLIKRSKFVDSRNKLDSILSKSIKLFGKNNNLLGDIYFNFGLLTREEKVLYKNFLPFKKSLENHKLHLGPNHYKVANCLNELGTSYANIGERDSALFYYERALNIYSEILPRRQLSIATVYNNIGTIYTEKGEKDVAFEYFQKAMDIQISKYGLINHYLGQTYLNKATTYIFTGEFESGLAPMDTALNIFLKVHGEMNSNVADVYNNLSSLYFNLGEIEEALELGKKSLDIRNSIFDPISYPIAESYNTLGVCYSRKKEYEKALEHFLEVESILLQIYQNKNHPRMGNCYNNIAFNLFKLQKFDEALSYHKKKLDVFLCIPGNWIPEIVLAYDNIGQIYYKKNEYDKAINYFKEAASLLENHLKGKPHPHLAKEYGNLGTGYVQIKEFSKAKYYLYKALEMRKNLFPNGTHEDLASNYSNIAGLHFRQGKILECINFYQMAINALVEDFSYSNIHENPSLDSKILQEEKLLPILQDKAEALLNYHQQDTSEIVFLHSAFKTLSLAVDLIDNIRNDQIRITTKERLLQEAFPIFEKAIEATNVLYQETKQDSFLNYMFNYFEKSKSVLLTEKIQETKAEYYSNIPKSHLEKSKKLKLEWLKLEEEREHFKANKEIQDSIDRKIFQVKGTHDSLILVFEKDFPNYYDLKYNFSTIPLDSLYQYLEKGSCIIEFFWGDSAVWSISLLTDTIKVNQISLDKQFLNSIKFLNSYGKEYFTSFSNSSDSIKEQRYRLFIEKSVEIYNSILDPIIRDEDKLKNLIIIPDGLIGYLPFDCLLKTTPFPLHEFDYQNLPYLINYFQINYEYSASILIKENKKEKSAKGRFIGFAPDYSYTKNSSSTKQSKNLTSRYQLLRNIDLSLLDNQSEVKEVSNILGGDLFIGTEATEAKFKEVAINYDILHFAGHALFDDSDRNFSHLLLSQPFNSKEDGQLFVSEIYEMSINSELVVLSACQTGDGNMKRGEGIMSLARAFKYAGCSKTVMTLWPANDPSTKLLMQTFYSELNKGVKAGDALRKAKLSLLSADQKNRYFHPAFWSNFILIGNNDSISSKTDQKFHRYLIVLCLIPIYFCWKWFRPKSLVNLF